MHHPHSATVCGEMEQIKTTNTLDSPCVCARALGLNNDRKKEMRCEDLGTKVDALRDLCNGMAMRAMKKSKVVAFHEFLQKKQ